MKIYTIQNTESGVAYPGAGKLWITEDAAIDWLMRFFVEQRGQSGLSRDQFVAAMRAGVTYEYTQPLDLVDDISANAIPELLYVRIDWVWGDAETDSAFYTAVSAQVLPDEMHRDEWTVQQ